ncbi:MAG: pyridoxamine 5'-phosphate oxidase [Rhodothermales bacterium]
MLRLELTLATVGVDGAASARTVSLKEVDGRGFIFTSQHEGPKGREMQIEPRVALVFYWPSQGRQVRVTGLAEPLPHEESVVYFQARSQAMRRMLQVSTQSQPVQDRAALEEALAHTPSDAERHAWGGYVVRPRTIEFWQGQADRLHDRFLYRMHESGWEVTRLVS